MKNEMVEVPVELLHQLLNNRREYFIICELFKIPLDKRGQEWVGKGIVERISTYLTSYVMRRSVIEKESGAAFTEQLAPLIQEPEVNHDNKA